MSPVSPVDPVNFFYRAGLGKKKFIQKPYGKSLFSFTGDTGDTGDMPLFDPTKADFCLR